MTHEIMVNKNNPDRCSSQPFCRNLMKVRGTYHCVLTQEEVDNGDEEDGSDYIFIRTKSCKESTSNVSE